MEEPIGKPGYAALRQFRESKPGAYYFLTVNLEKRGSGLETLELTDQIFRQGKQLEADGSWHVRSTVVMPDHVHWLVGLGPTAELPIAYDCSKGGLHRHCVPTA